MCPEAPKDSANQGAPGRPSAGPDGAIAPAFSGRDVTARTQILSRNSR